MDQDEFNVRAKYGKEIETSHHMPGKSWYRLADGREVTTDGEGEIKGVRDKGENKYMGLVGATNE